MLSFLLFFSLLFSVLAQDPPPPEGAPTNRVLTLVWNQNPEPDVTHYSIHWGTNSSVYPVLSTVVDEGGVAVTITNLLNGGSNYVWSIVTTNTSVTITGLDPSVRYFFSVKAYNISGLESGWTPELDVLMSERPIAPKDLRIGQIPVYELQIFFSDDPGVWEVSKSVKLVIDTEKTYQFVAVSNRVILMDSIEIE